MSGTHGSGTDLFNSVIVRAEADGVQINGVRGNWLPNSGSDNFTQYQTNIANGMSPSDAAANTWTGQIAASHGFTIVTPIENLGGGVQFEFTRPKK